MAVLRSLVLAAGAVLVVGVVRSAIRTVVVPRGEPTWIARYTLLGVRAVYDTVATLQPRTERRDRALARYGPSTLLGLAVVWALGVAAGFTAMFWALREHGFGDAVVLSGSSLTTLGFRAPEGRAETILAIVEAFLGLGIVALMISYLPTIYTLFARREAQVVKLDVRAGSPPTAIEMLTRLHRIGLLEEQNNRWDPWEDWFVELEESHTSHPVLVLFRSQRHGSSWITGAGAVLDTMALVVSALDVPQQPQTSMTIRSGFMALRAIARYYGVPFDPDPSPSDPISIYRGEFDLMCDALAAVGVPLRPDREQAWRDFAGWRVNYDVPLLALCSLCTAPATPWSSDRSGRFRRPTLWHPRWKVEPLDAPRSW